MDKPRQSRKTVPAGVWLNPDLKVLGHAGGSKKVDIYICRSKRLGHEVACKILLPEIAEDKTAVAALMREGSFLQRLHHPNLIQGFGTGTDPRPFLVMQFIPGQTFEQTFMKGNLAAFTLADLTDATMQIADALSHAHEQGLLHLDVKTSNLMYDDGKAVLFDFSVAREFTPDKVLKTESGTRDYKAPEQTLRQAAGYYTDVFGLGVVFYRLLTAGRLPYKAVDAGVDADGKKLRLPDYSVAPAPPSDLNTAVPEALSAVNLKMIAPKIKDRFATPEEARQAIEAAAAGTAAEPLR